MASRYAGRKRFLYPYFRCLESQPAIALVCRSVWGTGESAAFEPISGCYILAHISVRYLSLERLSSLTFLSKNKMIKKLQ